VLRKLLNAAHGGFGDKTMTQEQYSELLNIALTELEVKIRNSKDPLETAKQLKKSLETK